jgi:hypothetical protein
VLVSLSYFIKHCVIISEGNVRLLMQHYRGWYIRKALGAYLPSCSGSMVWIMSWRRPWRNFVPEWPVGPGAGREVMPLPAEPPAEPPAPDPPPTLVWLEVAALPTCCKHTQTHTQSLIFSMTFPSSYWVHTFFSILITGYYPELFESSPLLHTIFLPSMSASGTGIA